VKNPERKCECGALLTHYNQKRCPPCAKDQRKARDRISKGIALAPDAIECPVCLKKFSKITSHHSRHMLDKPDGYQNKFSKREVKPQYQLKDPKVRAKRKALKAYAEMHDMHERIITEHNLEKMERLTRKDLENGDL